MNTWMNTWIGEWKGGWMVEYRWRYVGTTRHTAGTPLAPAMLLAAPPYSSHYLSTLQVVATAALLLALRFAPPSLNSVWFCFFLFNG